MLRGLNCFFFEVFFRDIDFFRNIINKGYVMDEIYVYRNKIGRKYIYMEIFGFCFWLFSLYEIKFFVESIYNNVRKYFV